ncbi:hypothetical protein TSAR_011114 [Trichomalopsis sarcophagae]|uniref:Uncharacterized protein n=1 Tax=Trichomalopsis sarcophagae TaxID=543379 RepID=A0A232F1Z8_9HYME|nr:hypothetical protein TSAR_011114 [Trichomalopsis sarcophagae]
MYHVMISRGGPSIPGGGPPETAILEGAPECICDGPPIPRTGPCNPAGIPEILAGIPRPVARPTPGPVFVPGIGTLGKPSSGGGGPSTYKFRCIKRLNKNFRMWFRSNDAEDNHDKDYLNDMIYIRRYIVDKEVMHLAPVHCLQEFKVTIFSLDDVSSTPGSSWHLDIVYGSQEYFSRMNVDNNNNTANIITISMNEPKIIYHVKN